jgi:hypothetical protein
MKKIALKSLLVFALLVTSISSACARIRVLSDTIIIQNDDGIDLAFEIQTTIYGTEYLTDPCDTSVLCRLIYDESYKNLEGKVRIPEKAGNYTVDAICVEAFKKCSKLTEVVLPSGIGSIGAEAFSGCSSLTDINLPEGIVNINVKAFYGCKELETITLPKSMIYLADEAFSGCTSLRTVVNLDLSKHYGYRIFANCPNFTDIDFSTASGRLGALFAGHDGIKSVVLPNSVLGLDTKCFYGCTNLESVSLPDNLIGGIGEWSFAGCDRLMTVRMTMTAPCRVWDNVFSETTKKDGVLIIPKGTREVYNETEGWDFAHIVEMGEGEGIEEIVDTGRKAEDAVYDLQGRRVDSSMFNTQVSAREKGVYIRGGKKYMK